MSGGEPSSIKRSTECAAGKPVLSRDYEDRVGATFDLGVYGLVLQFGVAAEKTPRIANGCPRVSLVFC